MTEALPWNRFITLVLLALPTNSFSWEPLLRRTVCVRSTGRTHLPATTGGQRQQTKHTAELSPYYRRDIRYTTVGDDIHNKTCLGKLLADRYHTKKRVRVGMKGSQEALKEIDHNLVKYHQVRVYDRPRIWSPIDSEPPLAFHRLRNEARIRRLEQMFGTVGHPYKRVGRSDAHIIVDCPLAEPDIHERIRLMTELRLIQGKYENAKALEFELLLLGVRINAETMEWTNDPTHQFCHDNKPTQKSLQAQSLSQLIHVQTNSKANQTMVCDESDDTTRINQLLNRRQQALDIGDVLLAQFIALELCRAYNVSLEEDISAPNVRDIMNLQSEAKHEDSERRELRFQLPQIYHNQQSISASPPYSRSDMSETIDLHLEPRILNLVQERIHKREEGKFIEADAIRKELWYTYNIGLNDRLKLYSVGGKFKKRE
mmetsp:Transcript_26111/g.61429  ORF Transcript_26111/g.61429 Transcript_26111/m.61429 type:complete len:429 (+) Transcript_26111:2-1288(+)